MAKEIVSGIYKIENTVNGKCYIGSSVNFKMRIKMHKIGLKNGRHHSAKLQNAWNKHGADAFMFSLVEVVESKQNLIAREQYWIDCVNPDYNICRVAGSHLGVKRTQEAKNRMSASRRAVVSKPFSESHRANISSALAGHSIPLETRMKISAALTGKTVSIETRMKLSSAHAGKVMPKEAIEKTRLANLGSKRSEESREKMRLAQSNISKETRAKISASLKGKKFSIERCAKMSLAGKGKTHSVETKQKMSLAAKAAPRRTDEHNAKLMASRKRNQELKRQMCHAINSV